MKVGLRQGNGFGGNFRGHVYTLNKVSEKIERKENEAKKGEYFEEFGSWRGK